MSSLDTPATGTGNTSADRDSRSPPDLLPLINSSLLSFQSMSSLLPPMIQFFLFFFHFFSIISIFKHRQPAVRIWKLKILSFLLQTQIWPLEGWVPYILHFIHNHSSISYFLLGFVVKVFFPCNLLSLVCWGFFFSLLHFLFIPPSLPACILPSILLIISADKRFPLISDKSHFQTL